MTAPLRVAAALLCDAANVRENLINILSGGITRLWRDQLPGPMGVALALVIDLGPEACGVPHELAAIVIGPDDQQLGEFRGAFQADRSADLEAGERLLSPLALPLQAVVITAYGRHRLQVLMDGEEVDGMDFWVLHPGEQLRPVVPDFPPEPS